MRTSAQHLHQNTHGSKNININTQQHRQEGQRARARTLKFSTVLGTMSPNRPITIRPAFRLPISTSKYTRFVTAASDIFVEAQPIQIPEIPVATGTLAWAPAYHPTFVRVCVCVCAWVCPRVCVCVCVYVCARGAASFNGVC